MSRRRAQAETIPDVVEEQGGHVDQAVDAVENTAVAGDHRAHVLDPQVALDDADDEVAQLPTDADDQAGGDQILRPQVRKREPQGPRQYQGDCQRSQGPFPRLFRTDVAAQSVSLCAHLLQEPGTILILFPEGTRSGGAEPGEFKPGVALLAAGRDLPVVPCHLAGTHAALPKGAWCPRPRAVRLTIGPPRFYAHLPATKESAKQICRELREAVAALGRAGPEPPRVGEPAGKKFFNRPCSSREAP